MLAIRFKPTNFDYLHEAAKRKQMSVAALVATLTTTLQDFKDGNITEGDFLKYVKNL